MSNLAERAFQRHYRHVYRFVRRRSDSPELAEDITQDVFAAAAKALDRFEPGSSPVLAWLYTVARRRLADEARRERGRPWLVERLERDAPAADDVRRYGREVARALSRTVRRLPDEQRRVVVMKLLEGRSFAEIAQRLGTTEPATRMRFARGLERLRRELAREGIEP